MNRMMTKQDWHAWLAYPSIDFLMIDVEERFIKSWGEDTWKSIRQRYPFKDYSKASREQISDYFMELEEWDAESKYNIYGATWNGHSIVGGA